MRLGPHGVKLSSISYQNLFANLWANTNGLYVYWDTTNKFYITDYNLSGGANLYSDRLYRDRCGWYHVVIAFDTTQATAANRVKVYINGVRNIIRTAAKPRYRRSVESRISFALRWEAN